MKLPPSSVGEDVKIRSRRTGFSYWPAGHGKRRDKLQSTLFASDPWFLVNQAVGRISDDTARNQGEAFVRQARDFYTAADNSNVAAAKPLLLYYAFLNLAKALVVFSSDTAIVGTVKHGLSEKLPTTAGAIHGEISITTNDPNTAYALFSKTLGWALPLATHPATTVRVRSQDFLSQVLVGHRVFCQSEDLIERFVSLEEIQYRHDPATRQLWLRARLFEDDLKRLGYSRKELANALKRAGVWKNVRCDLEHDGRQLAEIEQVARTPYADRALDKLNELSAAVRPALWRSVTAFPPYRKYYVYFASASQVILHQLLGIYISTYYFGSITRYKPESWDGILRSKLGPFVNEFFSNQPAQFLYLIASEFQRQETTRAAIVA